MWSLVACVCSTRVFRQYPDENENMADELVVVGAGKALLIAINMAKKGYERYSIHKDNENIANELSIKLSELKKMKFKRTERLDSLVDDIANIAARHGNSKRNDSNRKPSKLRLLQNLFNAKSANKDLMKAIGKLNTVLIECMNDADVGQGTDKTKAEEFTTNLKDVLSRLHTEEKESNNEFLRDVQQVLSELGSEWLESVQESTGVDAVVETVETKEDLEIKAPEPTNQAENEQAKTGLYNSCKVTLQKAIMRINEDRRTAGENDDKALCYIDENWKLWKKGAEYLTDCEEADIPFNDLKLSHNIIGIGGCGIVTVAEWNGTAVAAKLLYANVTTVNGLIDLSAEISINKSLNSDHIVKVLGTSYDATLDQLYLVLELCERSLASWIEENKDEPINVETVCSFSLNICSAIKYLHEEKRIIHRDITPRNILLTKASNGDPPKAKLCDFGIAFQMLQVDTVNNPASVPSPAICPYKAPEARGTNAVLSFKSDIYSFGSVLNELIDKRTHSQKPEETTELQWVKKLVDMCLNQDRYARPTIVKIKEMLQQRKCPLYVEIDIDHGEENSSKHRDKRTFLQVHCKFIIIFSLCLTALLVVFAVLCGLYCVKEECEYDDGVSGERFCFLEKSPQYNWSCSQDACDLLMKNLQFPLKYPLLKADGEGRMEGHPSYENCEKEMKKQLKASPQPQITDVLRKLSFVSPSRCPKPIGATAFYFGFGAAKEKFGKAGGIVESNWTQNSYEESIFAFERVSSTSTNIYRIRTLLSRHYLFSTDEGVEFQQVEARKRRLSPFRALMEADTFELYGSAEKMFVKARETSSYLCLTRNGYRRLTSKSDNCQFSIEALNKDPIDQMLPSILATDPSSSPTLSPIKATTLPPSKSPTLSPIKAPTLFPSKSPTFFPSKSPTLFPSESPTLFPSKSPTTFPSKSPTLSPSISPTLFPSKSPTPFPSISPTFPPAYRQPFPQAKRQHFSPANRRQHNLQKQIFDKSPVNSLLIIMF